MKLMPFLPQEGHWDNKPSRPSSLTNAHGAALRSTNQHAWFGRCARRDNRASKMHHQSVMVHSLSRLSDCRFESSNRGTKQGDRPIGGAFLGQGKLPTW